MNIMSIDFFKAGMIIIVIYQEHLELHVLRSSGLFMSSYSILFALFYFFYFFKFMYF